MTCNLRLISNWLIREVSGINTDTKTDESVHMVIKTNALIYDDRFRKEVQSLQRIGVQVTGSVLEDANEARSGHDYGDGQQQSFSILSLFTRKLLKHRAFVLLHLCEFILRVLFDLIRNKPKVVWVHDPILLVFMPFLALFRRFGVIERVVWDHHELPLKRIDDSPFLRKVFGWFCARADVLIAANVPRLNYLTQHYPNVSKVKRFAVIRNYSDREFVEQPAKALPDELNNWLAGREYLLVQSGLVEIRNFRAVADTLIPDDALPPLVVVGGGDKKLIAEYRQRYGEQFNKRVYLIDKVPQMELTRYLDGALASIIFYNQHFGINNWLCEPNRLFQALNRNRPVIVGNNPPMAEMVNWCRYGVVADDDGSNQMRFAEALQRFMTEKQGLQPLDSQKAFSIQWESQDPVFRDVIGLQPTAQR